MIACIRSATTLCVPSRARFWRTSGRPYRGAARCSPQWRFRECRASRPRRRSTVSPSASRSSWAASTSCGSTRCTTRWRTAAAAPRRASVQPTTAASSSPRSPRICSSTRGCSPSWSSFRGPRCGVQRPPGRRFPTCSGRCAWATRKSSWGGRWTTPWPHGRARSGIWSRSHPRRKRTGPMSPWTPSSRRRPPRASARPRGPHNLISGHCFRRCSRHSKRPSRPCRPSSRLPHPTRPWRMFWKLNTSRELPRCCPVRPQPSHTTVNSSGSRHPKARICAPRGSPTWRALTSGMRGSTRSSGCFDTFLAAGTAD
mmetsp:Transcript_12061/g.37514  ORF Transcript_12061/g.37514 Transcript_12061/m.37514 type:complete len:313 (-) Transcript_12061:62-1000(-)